MDRFLQTYRRLALILLPLALLEYGLALWRWTDFMTGKEAVALLSVFVSFALMSAAGIAAVLLLSAHVWVKISGKLLRFPAHWAAGIWTIFSFILLFKWLLTLISMPFTDPTKSPYIANLPLIVESFIPVVILIATAALHNLPAPDSSLSFLQRSFAIAISATLGLLPVAIHRMLRKSGSGGSFHKLCSICGWYLVLPLVFINLNYTLLPRSYQDYHRLLGFFTLYFIVAAAILSLNGVAPRPVLLKRLLIHASWQLAVVLVAFPALHISQNLKLNAFSRSEYLRAEFSLFKRAADFDSDGFLTLFNGSDPDNFNHDETPFTVLPRGVEQRNYIHENRVPQHPAPPAVKRVILITIDTLRKDHLGLYGYHRPTSPNIDSLGADSLVFDNAYAFGPSTRISIPALLSGRYVNRNQDYYKLPTFLRIFAAQGWTIAAYPETPYARRFFQDHVDNLSGTESLGFKFSRDSSHIAQSGIHFLSQHRDEPTALWLHFFNPHDPYQLRSDRFRFGTKPVDLYDHNIAYDDDNLGRFLRYLREHGLYDDSLIILTADHGESFNEHGWYFHGNNLYQYLVNIPFLIKIPGFAPGRTMDVLSHLDVVPTMLYYAGIPSELTFNGTPYLPGDGLPRPGKLIINTSPPYCSAVMQWPWKLIWYYRSDTFELFNLADDPRETANAFDRNPNEARAMQAILWNVLRQGTGSYLD